MKFYYLLFILLLIPFSYAIDIEPGDTLNLTTVKCYGDISIKVRSDNNITKGDYNFENCKETKDNIWSCNCNKGIEQSIILLTKKNIKTKYNIVLYYYIKPKLEADNDSTTQTQAEIQNDINERRKSFNINIKNKPKETINIEEELSNILPLIVFVIVIVIIASIVGIYFIFKMFTKEENINNLKEEVNTNDMSDEEVLRHIRNNFK